MQRFGESVIDYEEASSFSRALKTALFYCGDVLLHSPISEVITLCVCVCAFDPTSSLAPNLFLLVVKCVMCRV